MVDLAPNLDYQEQVARIERSQEETRKFASEQHKLMAEAAKFERERTLYPAALAVGVIGALIGSAATLIGHWLH